MGNEKVEAVGTDMHTVTTLGTQNIQQLMAIIKTVLIILLLFFLQLFFQITVFPAELSILRAHSIFFISVTSGFTMVSLICSVFN